MKTMSVLPWFERHIIHINCDALLKLISNISCSLSGF